MQLQLQLQQIPYVTSRTVPFLLLLFSFIFPLTAQADNQNTAFFPLKVNAPNKIELQQQVDQALARELDTKQLALIPRNEAAKLVDYEGTWPPPATALTRIADQTGYDYIAVGSLTQIGERISLDVSVFDVLNPVAFHNFFQEASSVGELDLVTHDAVTDILRFTKRSVIIASIAPAGNERIDSGAILRKINTKPGDFYDPSELRQDLKSVFSMGYFDDVAGYNASKACTSPKVISTPR